MSKLKLGPLEDNKPVKVSVELSAATHRDLLAYAETLGKETGRSIGEPSKLIAPMIQRFMASDRGFAKLRRERPLKHAAAILPKLPKQAT
jgi:hypothetical protein